MPRSDAAADPVRDRHGAMLRSALGPAIVALLDDPLVTDILLNPDGALWASRHGEGCRATGIMLSASDGERIIRLVASQNGLEIHHLNPSFTAQLAGGKARFAGLLPPAVTAPAFAIRKPATALFTLTDYVRDGILSESQELVLEAAVRRRLNILVAGGTGSGKTTLANALLAVLADESDRVLIIEDTPELRCAAANVVTLRTVPGVRPVRDLVRAAMHLFPQRIVVGEILGGEALDLLKAWNTGHPGGIATCHANSAAGALTKLVQFVQEAVVTVPRELIAEAVDLVLFIELRGGRRRLRTIASVDNWDGTRWGLRPIADPADLPTIQPEENES